jgi:sugar phosphate isomerase/epimerase
MKISQVAAQMYTVRDFLKTPEDIAASLGKVQQIGYQAVQLSGLAPIENQQLARICQESGLTVCATHEVGATIISQPEAVIEKLKLLRCSHTAYPYPSDVTLETAAEVRAFAKQLEAAGKVMQSAGLTLSYHNHSIEFRRLGEKTILELLYEETDPRYLQAEPDTYWIQHGGGDPVAWCKKLHGRLPLLHMKDYGITADSRPTYFEIGQGNLDWVAIVQAAEASGCEWFIVEQDTCAGDPFDSLRVSFEYIQEHLVS